MVGRTCRVFLVFLVAAAPGVRAQPLPLPVAHEYLVRVYTVADGLMVSNVRGVAQGTDAFLYVATGRGLARFDGYGFEPIPAPHFDSDHIAGLHRGGGGRIWLWSSVRGVVGYIDGGRFQTAPQAPARVRMIYEDRGGGVWLVHDGGLAFHPRPTAGGPTRFTAVEGLPNDSVVRVSTLGARTLITTRQQIAVVEFDTQRPGAVRAAPVGPRYTAPRFVRADSTGVWVATSKDGTRSLLHFDGERFLQWSDPAASAVLRRDAAAWDGVHVLDASAVAGAEAPWGKGHATLRSGLRARDGTRWWTAEEAHTFRHFLVRERDGRFQPFDLRRHLDFTSINGLFEDHEGSLWVSTDRGLIQVAPRTVFALGREHGLAETFSVPVLETGDGALWVGTWGGGLHRFAGGSLADRFAFTGDLAIDRIRALYEAGDGTLWAGARYGVMVGLRRSRIAETITLPGAAEVRAFAETPDGRLWIGTEGQLLFRTASGVTEHRPGFWTDRPIWAMHTARDGALWIGTERGLFQLRGDSVLTLRPADGPGDAFVVSIHEEADGTLWFGTYYQGLHRYRHGRFVTVTTREGLHHDGVWRMLEDGAGGGWMSSDGGIFRVERTRLHAVADALERGERPSTPLRPLAFTEAHGMPSRESNRASPAGARLRDGRLVFNNVAGLVVVDPALATREMPTPRTVLRSVTADGTVLRSDSATTELPAGVRHVSFAFAALSFLAPQQNRYRYRLDGYDHDWIDAGTTPVASYTNLPPGRYTFRVQGRSGGSDWSEAAATHALTVPPLFWQRWPVRLLAAALVLTLLTVVYRYRVARLLEMERLRLRIASDLHDDVGSNLSSIAMLSDMLQQAQRLDLRERRQLARIQAAAEQTVAGLRDIIWIVDPKHDTLEQLLLRMRAVAASLLEGTSCRFETPEPLRDRRLSMSFVRNVFLLYKEALHNVAKHAAARTIHVRVQDRHGVFELRIRDDGTGFDTRVTSTGSGLANMRRRAALAGGDFDVVSTRGQGTEITFRARIAWTRDRRPLRRRLS